MTETLDIGKDQYQKLMRILREAGYVSQRIVRKPDGTILSNRITVRSIPKPPESVAPLQQPEKPAAVLTGSRWNRRQVFQANYKVQTL